LWAGEHTCERRKKKTPAAWGHSKYKKILGLPGGDHTNLISRWEEGKEEMK